MIFEKELKVSGFVITSISAPYLEQFYTEVPKLIKAGKLKFCDEDISYGLNSVSTAICDVQHGRNKGKKIIVVADE